MYFSIIMELKSDETITDRINEYVKNVFNPSINFSHSPNEQVKHFKTWLGQKYPYYYANHIDPDAINDLKKKISAKAGGKYRIRSRKTRARKTRARKSRRQRK